MNMKKILSVLLSITMVMSTLAFSASALTQDEANSALESAVSVFDEVLEKLDVAGDDGKITAADARATLLYSAGLSNSAAADVDGDGSVTAIDARMLLRYAAGLESVDYLYTAEDKLAYFNAIINSIKPNGYKYYACEGDKTVDVTYDNQSLVDDFTNQLSSLADTFNDDSLGDFDFGAELTSDVGNTTYSSSTSTASSSNYFIIGDELASYLEADNIVSIEYKENQSFIYEEYKTSNVLGEYIAYTTSEITGLSSITLYIKDDDTLTEAPSDSLMLNNGRAFNLITQDTIDSIDLASSFLGDLGGLEDLGTFEVSSAFESITYHDAYITIYFYPETGVPVATEHSLSYDLVTSLYMNIVINLTETITDMLGMSWLAALDIFGAGKLLDLEGTINLTTSLKDTTVCCFYNNAGVTKTTAS